MPAHAQGSEGMSHTGETLWEARENRSGGEETAQIAPFAEASTAALMAAPKRVGQKKERQRRSFFDA